MNKHLANKTSVSALLGAPVQDGSGHLLGRVQELVIDPEKDMQLVDALVIRPAGAEGKRNPMLIRIAELRLDSSCRIFLHSSARPEKFTQENNYLLLERDVLDQQIIDVNGHKVVRVNDVDLSWLLPGEEQKELALRVAEVEVGMRGALRRLLKGLPDSAVHAFAQGFGPSVIPWDFVDLIDRDPARRVKLKIEQDRLSRMHPSDIADILEELAPAERQALFNSLDEEVAAEALEEVEPRMQQALIESMDSEQIAGIVEEMDPGAAADLLSELSEEQSDAILEEMDPEERHDVEELLEFPSDSAAGRMTTEYVALSEDAAVVDAIVALRSFEGDVDALNDIYLLDSEQRLKHVVPIVKLLLASGGESLRSIWDGHIVSCGTEASGKKVAELFDKYNLRSLPVVDEEKRLVGVVHAEQVISWLRSRR